LPQPVKAPGEHEQEGSAARPRLAFATKCQYQAAGFEKTEVTLGREVALGGAQPANDQEHRADENVEAVEACRHEEGRGVNAVREFEMRVRVFVNLEAQEDDAEPTVMPSACTASFFLPSRMAWCAHVTVQPESSRIMVIRKGRPNGGMVSIAPWAARHNRLPRSGGKCRAEERPEKRDEEHDFGCDEQRHAETQTDFGDFIVNAFRYAFENDVLPPEEHDGENSQDAQHNAFQADILSGG
jgi:hypothetical protein